MMDPDDFQTDSEPENTFLPAGIGSDVDEHTLSESEEDDGTPKMSPVSGLPDFSADQDLGALIAQVGGDQANQEAGPSHVTSSFLSMPENLTSEKLKVKKTEKVKQQPKGKEKKKRTKRKGDKSSDEKGDAPKKKKKKKSKKEDKDKDLKKKIEASDRHKRRNIKTFLREDELEAETLNAQREEEERKKRLEEQRALNADLATLSELLSDDVPSQPPQPLQTPATSQQSHPPSHPTSSRHVGPSVPPPLAPLPRMPLPVPVLTPDIQSQMMKSFPPSPFRSHMRFPPFPSLMPSFASLPKPKPPPKTVDGYIVLDDSSGDEDSNKKASDDVINISSGDEDVTVVSDGSGKEDAMEEEDDGADEDPESSGVHSNDAYNKPDAYGRVLVNVAHPPDEPDIFLADHLSRIVKAHQIGGIRFLYDNLVESLNRFKNSAGFGCILAHSMGLGKTLQLVSFTDIFMRHTGAKTVLIIVPINTLQNWVAEFDMWLPDRTSQSKFKRDRSKPDSSTDDTCDDNDEQSAQKSLRTFRLFVVNDMHKTTDSRLSVIDEWYTEGGVLLMGYEMYRLLCSRKQTRARKKPSARKKTQIIDLEEEDRKEGMIMDIRRALVKPGPDLVICDEGHRIKNSLAGISQALKTIRTRRRVVLTGYPLQNNLQEYWCMVDFVRPNFLGTKHEFANLFERPISNGQCMDSTPNDVRLMKHRAHVLHKLLEGFVQRRGFGVLQSALPPKEEHVLLVRLTTFQRGLYIRFMQRFTEAGAAGWCNTNPLKAFSVACKIWNHPDVLCEVLQTREGLDDSDLDLPEFNPKSKCGRKKGSSKDTDASSNNGESASTSARSSPSMDFLASAGAANSKSSAPVSIESYQDKVNEILSFEWARDLMKNYQQNKISNSGKMVLLFKILEDSIKVGDKILIFSQSLMTLSVVEKFLAMTPIPQPDDPPEDMPTKWVRNSTYFRLDGSTPVSEREKMINEFNAPNSKLWAFLLSTRAGSLGINLIGANRVVVLDASWNPCHDAQAVCRVYRYGQKKRCYVYRMVTDNTLEKKIYDRQISKKGMSDRVVDEMNPEMNLTKKEVESLLEFDESDMPFEDFSHLAANYQDPILKDICMSYSNSISKAPFTTESLLMDRRDRRLTRAEKRQAESNYEAERKLNLSYSRPSYAAYYAQGNKSRVNISANAAQASSLPSSFMSRYTVNRPVANVRPIQSTPVPKTPMNSNVNMQQRLLELRNAGVTVQKITATTDIILPGTNTLTNSTPLIRAGEQVTFIKTQKGVYLRTTDGRILAVRGAQQPNKAETKTTSSSGLPLGQGIVPSLATGSFPASTETSSSNEASGSGRHQLADLLSEKVTTASTTLTTTTTSSSCPFSLSDDSDFDGDFFDPFKSPVKSQRQGGSAKPATCTVSPGVQSVPLASTLPLGSFGQNRQSGNSSPPAAVVNPTPASSEATSTPPVSEGLTNQMSSMDLQLPNSNDSNLPPPTSTSAPAPASGTETSSTNQTSNSTPTTNSNMPYTNTSMQQPMQHPGAPNYGMPYFPGMMPMPPTSGNSQQQQPPIVINYQLPMPPGAMMQPGFMPFGFPPMMYPGGPPTSQGQYPGMYGGMGGQMPGQMGQTQGGQDSAGQNQSNQPSTTMQSDTVNTDQSGDSNMGVMNSKMAEMESSQSSANANA